MLNNYIITLFANDPKIGTGQTISITKGVACDYVRFYGNKMLQDSIVKDNFNQYYFEVKNIGYKQDRKIKFLMIPRFTNVTNLFYKRGFFVNN